MVTVNSNFNLDYTKTFILAFLGFFQGFAVYMPFLQFIIAILTIIVLAKKILSKNGKE